MAPVKYGEGSWKINYVMFRIFLNHRGVIKINGIRNNEKKTNKS